jgi:cell division protease FtsH
MVKDLGHVAYENEPVGFLNNNITQKQFSEATAREIDVAVRAIVKTAYDKALGILSREKTLLSRWAEKLLEKETLVESELDELKGSIGAAASAYASAPRPDRPIPVR